MVGESLEQHCENEYKNTYPTSCKSTFKKDNDASSGSKEGLHL